MKDLIKAAFIISYLVVVFVFNFVGFYGSMYPFLFNYFPGKMPPLKTYSQIFVSSNLVYLLGNLILPFGILITIVGWLFFKKRFSSRRLVGFLLGSFRVAFVLTTVTPLINAITFTIIIGSVTPSWFRFILNGIALLMVLYFKADDFIREAEPVEETV